MIRVSSEGEKIVHASCKERRLKKTASHHQLKLSSHHLEISPYRESDATQVELTLSDYNLITTACLFPQFQIPLVLLYYSVLDLAYLLLDTNLAISLILPGSLNGKIISPEITSQDATRVKCIVGRSNISQFVVFRGNHYKGQ
jgi:hypothetical protein